MQFNRDKHKRFEGILFHFPYTLPSSSASFASDTELKMNDGSYNASSSSSYGSYYNGRVANSLKASDAIAIKDYIDNICAKNWTLPTRDQFINVLSYRVSWNASYPGMYNGSSRKEVGMVGRYWARTAYSTNQFDYLYAEGARFEMGNRPTNYTVQSGLQARCLVE